MKPIKMFGLAALAALMAMAFVGASSAMAESTALCSNDVEVGCTEIIHVHETSVGKAKLLSEPTVECDVLFLGDTVSGTSAPLHISGKFTYTNCNNSCSVEEVNGPALIQVLKTATDLAAVTGKGLVKLTCFFGFIKCAYNGEGLEGHGTGPLKSAQTNGSIVIEEQETHIESGSCPESAFLDITTTSLSATYLGRQGAVEADKMVCIFVGDGNGYYLSSGNGTSCTKKDAFEWGEYELGYVADDIGSNEMACAFVGSGNGFFLNFGNGTSCTKEDAFEWGEYELGETT